MRNVGLDGNFVLTLANSEIQGLYKSVFPVVWKATEFRKTGSYELTVRYQSDFAIAKAEIDAGGIASTSVYTHYNGEGLTLKEKGDPPVYYFAPSPGREIKNGTKTSQDIGYGFYEKPDTAPTQALIYPKIGPGSSIPPSDFRSVLMAHVWRGYKEGEVLKGPISRLVFNQNLVSLDEHTNWKLEYNPETDLYSVTQEF